MDFMITTVTPNPAIDITYTLDELHPGESNRVNSVAERAGGKGINVARVLHCCGESATVAGLFGGDSGTWILNELFTIGITCEPTLVGLPSRRTVTVVADAEDYSTTVLNERGPATTPAEWDALTTTVTALVARSEVLVVSGSLPPGGSAASIRPLITAARHHGIPCIVDTTRDGLLEAARAGASVLKPNIDELREAFHTDVRSHRDIVETARLLVSLGAERVIVSLGADGVIGVDRDEAYWCSAIDGISGNPTGAGDAAVAGIAQALTRNADWPDILRNAVAFGAAAVLAPEAGDVNSTDVERFLSLAHPTVLSVS